MADSAPKRAGAEIDLVADAPPLVPGAPAIDRAHLARMTHGERDLEREVLHLYATQAGLLLNRMLAEPKGRLSVAAVAALAHTLSGSSRGIGAWEVAAAAASLEADVAQGRDIAASVARLTQAIRTAQNTIAELLRG